MAVNDWITQEVWVLGSWNKMDFNLSRPIAVFSHAPSYDDVCSALRGDELNFNITLSEEDYKYLKIDSQIDMMDNGEISLTLKNAPFITV